MAYLFVHFREKETPDGEQVHFALSKDGFNWTQVNGGNPVLYSKKGERGVRDFTIARLNGGGFVILATDLSLANCFKTKYHGSWEEISTVGSHDIVLWRSKDLVHWGEQEMITLGGDELGCRWAPDIIYDEEEGDYLLHWSSSRAKNGFGNKAIYYSRTKDFKTFSEPKILYEKENSGVIDSCIVHDGEYYYMFLKSEGRPKRNILLRAKSPAGEYERVTAFDREMLSLKAGVYEAPTAFKLKGGRWCLMLDYYGERGAKQGYVPFISEKIQTGIFLPARESFSFPYGFKHGSVLKITGKEYEKIRSFNFSSVR